MLVKKIVDKIKENKESILKKQINLNIDCEREREKFLKSCLGEEFVPSKSSVVPLIGGRKILSICALLTSLLSRPFFRTRDTVDPTRTGWMEARDIKG